MTSIKVKAFSLLARRAYFSKELEQKLLTKGFTKSEIAPLINELKQQGWLNDKELAERFVARQREKGYGAKVIALKLKFKAGDVPVSVEDGDIFSIIEKKYRQKLPEQRNKVIAALMRRGFPYDLIDNALNSITEEKEFHK